MRSISDGGGSSATNRCASSREMKCAVEGWRGQNVQHLLAVLHPAAGRNVTPSTTFSPLSWALR